MILPVPVILRMGDIPRHGTIFPIPLGISSPWEMNFPVRGYNECLIMYVLAVALAVEGADQLLATSIQTIFELSKNQYCRGGS
ncbi:hypothetical protein [Bacteroides sp. 51]|uniref:hypothetical protein n=1 Tax=Bacteroides sp. 51 TaxID=2302938 RepID=UPI0013D41211|nr:hypothetical protein [Bacteroides sp. 51]NDV85033.1 hypothetical protein [Bacteroides sp. 51]